MAYPMGEAKPAPPRVDFDRRLKLDFTAARSPQTLASRRLPNDRFLAPDCVSARSRTHRAPYPKTPNWVVGSRFQPTKKCASVFGGWEKPSGKSRINVWVQSLVDHLRC